MQPSERSVQARREIDRKFRHSNIDQIRTRPRSGWIRAIRGALGMSQQALAARLGVSREAAAKLEKAELRGGITVAKLAQIAAALDCTLIYAVVPNTSLDNTVWVQARRVAANRLGYVATTMALEDQGISPERRAEHLESYARDLIAHNDVWRAS